MKASGFGMNPNAWLVDPFAGSMGLEERNPAEANHRPVAQTANGLVVVVAVLVLLLGSWTGRDEPVAAAAVVSQPATRSMRPGRNPIEVVLVQHLPEGCLGVVAVPGQLGGNENEDGHGVDGLGQSSDGRFRRVATAGYEISEAGRPRIEHARTERPASKNHHPALLASVLRSFERRTRTTVGRVCLLFTRRPWGSAGVHHRPGTLAARAQAGNARRVRCCPVEPSRCQNRRNLEDGRRDDQLDRSSWSPHAQAL